MKIFGADLIWGAGDYLLGGECADFYEASYHVVRDAEFGSGFAHRQPRATLREFGHWPTEEREIEDPRSFEPAL